MYLSDATSVIQPSIFSACKSKMNTSEWASIKFEAGEYPVRLLQIPDRCRLLLFGEDKATLVHKGRRRQPLFMLGESSILKLQDLEINYKGKERFMFHGRTRNPDNVVMENVKIRRIIPLAHPTLPKARPEDPVDAKQLLSFLRRYVDSYRKECKNLTATPPDGAGYPTALLNRAYTDSRLIRVYLLRDGVVIADVVEAKPSEGYLLDNSMEIMPARLKETLVEGTDIEVVTAKHSLGNFVSMITLGMFNVQTNGEAIEFGRHSGFAKLMLRNDRLKKERPISYIAWYPYLDKGGWHPKNAWIYAFYDVRYDIAGAIAMQEKAGKVFKVDNGGEIVAIPTDVIWREYDIKTKLGAKLGRFSKDLEEFKRLLESKFSHEATFLKYLDDHPHLLDLYAVSIEPQPFLKIPEEKLSTIRGRGRLPDYIAKYRDDTYMLIEIERPDKPIFVGNDIQPSHQLTQAINQVSIWDEIIRSFGNYLVEYPGIRNHTSLVVIGREHCRKFSSMEEFRTELNRINQLHNRINVITFDDLVERAEVAIAKIAAIQSALG